jgi:hypothetical protein
MKGAPPLFSKNSKFVKRRRDNMGKNTGIYVFFHRERPHRRPYLGSMKVRNVTMTMAFFCLMLTSVFALSGILYDVSTFLWYSVGLFIFGNLYCTAVFLLALLHDILPNPHRALRASFWLAFIPTALYFLLLYVIAFL